MLITRCYLAASLSAAPLSAALFATLLLAGCGKAAPPDAIVTGTLYTMDPAQPRVEAVAIDNGRFSYVGDQAAAMALKGPETRVIHLADGIAYPGLIDAHMHIESTLLTPAELARLVVPRGTTTVVADPHEIGNVLGVRGVEQMLEASEGLPLD